MKPSMRPFEAIDTNIGLMHGELTVNAAAAAASILTRNWKDAIPDGCNPVDLIKDVDETIAHLLAFKRTAGAAFGLDIDEPALVADHPEQSGSDFTLADNAQSCWIRVGNVSVHVQREIEGAVVDLFAAGAPDQTISSTYALYSVAEEEICAHNGNVDLDAVGEWVGLHHRINFDAETPAKRAGWIRRYAEAHAVDLVA